MTSPWLPPMIVSFPYPPSSQLWTPLSPTSVWRRPARPLSIFRHSFAGHPAWLVLAADARPASHGPLGGSASASSSSRGFVATGSSRASPSEASGGANGARDRVLAPAERRQ